MKTSPPIMTDRYKALRTTLFSFVLGCCLLPGLAAGASSSSATDVVLPDNEDRLHIYLLMGQSNMAGRDTGALEAQVDDPRVLALDYEGNWKVARDPIHKQIGRPIPGHGPGIAFAREMLRNAPEDVVIGLVPCAVGGSPLRRWVKGGDLYGEALERAEIAARSGTIKGVLWHQGETDSDKQSEAETYASRLSGMIRDLRQDLGKPGLPVAVGQLGEFLSTRKFSYVDTVRDAIRQVSESVPHVGYADSAGLGDKGDRVHFDKEAAFELGKRFAHAMQALHDESDLPVGVFRNLLNGETQTVVVYGTSLTHKGAWADAMAEYFEEAFPGQVKFHNAAKSGMHSNWGLENLERRVLRKQPDLVLIEFSANDAATKHGISPEQSRANLEAMVEALRQQNPQVAIVLQTMNPAWDSPESAPKKYASDRPNLEAYYAVYRDFAQAEGLPLVDHYPNWVRLRAESPEVFKRSISDGIHPNSSPSRLVTWPPVRDLMEEARRAAASGAAEGRGAQKKLLR